MVLPFSLSNNIRHRWCQKCKFLWISILPAPQKFLVTPKKCVKLAALKKQVRFCDSNRCDSFFLSQANISQLCDSNRCDIFFLSQANLPQKRKKNPVSLSSGYPWSCLAVLCTTNVPRNLCRNAFNICGLPF